jgi:tetratricopeptide (TPR) repeat protein
VILVPAEHLVTRCLDLVTGLAHEIVHCRRRTSDHAPDGSSRRVGPLWLEEGLAHWLSDVDAEDIPGLLEGAAGSSSATARAFAAAIAGTGTLENAAPDLQQAAGALLFWDLEQRVGREKVQALARTLLDGGEWSAALAGLDHRAPEEILRSLRDRAETLLAALMPGREEFGRLVALDASEKGAEALAKADAFLAAFPTSPRRGRAEFYRGHALFLLGRYDEALDQLHAVLRRESDGDVASVAEFWIVMIAEQREEWETVVRDGTGYLRDYVFAPANYRKRTQASVDAASEWITFLRPTPKKR